MTSSTTGGTTVELGSDPLVTPTVAGLVAAATTGYAVWQVLVARPVSFIFFAPRDPRSVTGDYVAPRAAFFQSVASAVYVLPVVAIAFLADTGTITITAALTISVGLMVAALLMRAVSESACVQVAERYWEAVLLNGEAVWLTR